MGSAIIDGGFEGQKRAGPPNRGEPAFSRFEGPVSMCQEGDCPRIPLSASAAPERPSRGAAPTDLSVGVWE